jgi:hypothetical protein
MASSAGLVLTLCGTSKFLWILYVTPFLATSLMLDKIIFKLQDSHKKKLNTLEKEMN